jgi:calcyclin binding protein
MENSRRESLQADLAEAEAMLGLATRTLVREHLLSLKQTLEKTLRLLEVEESKMDIEEPARASLAAITIDKFAWEQTSKAVKVYVTSLGNLKSLSPDQVQLYFTEDSVSVTVVDLEGANYRLAFTKLSKPIQNCSVVRKSNGFSLTLTKKDSGHWDSVEYKPNAIKGAKKTEKEDPTAGLMNMMKDLYETGDDDIKRTIAEAWTKSRDKTPEA